MKKRPNYNSDYIEYSGVIHIHSTYSDGRHAPEKIIRAAARAGCDFAILTDHNTLQAKSLEGWHGKTLLLVGEEITTCTDSHYMALGAGSEVPPGLSARETIEGVNSRGGFGIICHPFSRKKSPDRMKLTGYPWLDWSVPGFSGLEIWNYSEDWVDDIENQWHLKKMLIGLINPGSFIQGPYPETLRQWDEITAKGVQAAGIGSLDAHGFFYSYHRMFRALRTHILLPGVFNKDLNHDREMLLEALRLGRCFVGHDGLRSSRGFTYTAYNQSGIQAQMGGTLPLQAGVTLVARSPAECRLQLYLNGTPVAAKTGTRAVFTVHHEGVYRLEASLGKQRKPWVYTNPIYVGARC